eukprot:766894-Hanusia_phi.AAC.10
MRVRNLTLELFKQAVSLVVLTQARMSRSNEFCLCVLLEGAVLCSEFTSDISQFLEQVYALEGQEPFRELDMASVFHVLKERKEALAGSPKDMGADNLLRGILLYARSHVPTFGGDEAAWRELSGDPDVVLDTLFVRSVQGSKEKAQEIFDFFIDLDQVNSGIPYTFESVLNPKKSVCPLSSCRCSCIFCETPLPLVSLIPFSPSSSPSPSPSSSPCSAGTDSTFAEFCDALVSSQPMGGKGRSKGCS